MFFKKKKPMIDIRKLHKGGVVHIPKENVVISTARDGFVEMNSDSKPTTQSSNKSNFFSFMDSAPTNKTSDSFGSESEGYNKREVDTKITELDNKIYKLEQRIELLEKKLNVNYVILKPITNLNHIPQPKAHTQIGSLSAHFLILHQLFKTRNSCL